MTNEKPTVAVIGLGIMGGHMAANLVKAGYDVIGYNRSRAKVDALVEAGGRGADSIAEAVQGRRRDHHHGAGLPRRRRGRAGRGRDLRATPSPERCGSTAPPSGPTSRLALAEAGREAGIRVLDAPVSGGEAGAKEAKLSIMVGGEEADFEEVRPILEAIGSTIVLVGPAGSGQTVKAANQLIVAGNYQLVAEAIVFLRAYGVDTEAALKVLAGGLAGSTVLNRKGASMLAGDFAPGFRIDLHHKDMGIILEAARAKGVTIPLGAVSAQLIAALRAQGDGGLDHSALLRGVERLSGQKVSGE